MISPIVQKDQDFHTGSQMGRLRPKNSLQVEEGAQV